MNNNNKLLIVTGTGRSGTSYMVGVLRKVYGFGLSAEPKDVLDICKYASRLNLKDDNQLRQAIYRASKSKFLSTQ